MSNLVSSQLPPPLDIEQLLIQLFAMVAGCYPDRCHSDKFNFYLKKKKKKEKQTNKKTPDNLLVNILTVLYRREYAKELQAFSIYTGNMFCKQLLCHTFLSVDWNVKY